MISLRRSLLLLSLMLFVTCCSIGLSKICFEVDEYSTGNCEEQQARLDNYAFVLQEESDTTAYIIVYGSATKDHSGRGPYRGEARERANGIRDYLITTRNIQKDRIITIDGGFRETWLVQLFTCPRGVEGPRAFPTVPLKDVHLKGKIRRGAYAIFCG